MRCLGPDFPVFNWSELLEKEDPIGRGTFGSVFVAKRGSLDGDGQSSPKLIWCFHVEYMECGLDRVGVKFGKNQLVRIVPKSLAKIVPSGKRL